MKNRNLNHKDDWATPEELYNSLNSEFHFDFDPCPLNYEIDGLTVDWKQRNFVNPPYSRHLKEAFIKKAYEQSKKTSCVYYYYLYPLQHTYSMKLYIHMQKSDF